MGPDSEIYFPFYSYQTSKNLNYLILSVGAEDGERGIHTYFKGRELVLATWEDNFTMSVIIQTAGNFPY